MATHSSTLAWKIPWTEEPGRLQSMGLQRVGHYWVTSQARKFESVGLGSNLGICFFFLFTGVFVNSKTGCPRTLGETKAQVENSNWEQGLWHTHFCTLRVCHVNGAKGMFLKGKGLSEGNVWVETQVLDRTWRAFNKGVRRSRRQHFSHSSQTTSARTRFVGKGFGMVLLENTVDWICIILPKSNWNSQASEEVLRPRNPFNPRYFKLWPSVFPVTLFSQIIPFHILQNQMF